MIVSAIGMSALCFAIISTYIAIESSSPSSPHITSLLLNLEHYLTSIYTYKQHHHILQTYITQIQQHGWNGENIDWEEKMQTERQQRCQHGKQEMVQEIAVKRKELEKKIWVSNRTKGALIRCAGCLSG